MPSAHPGRPPQIKRAKRYRQLVRGAFQPETVTADQANQHHAFFPLVAVCLILWIGYRLLFHFPVWFDETIGKAVFFGLPVWMYVFITRNKQMMEAFDVRRLQSGLFLGLAIGGVFGFAASLATLVSKQVVFQSVPLFISTDFWYEFMLAMLTGFWESLFFYVWIMVVVVQKLHRWPLLNQLLLVTGIFLVFHIPNTLLRFSPIDVAPQLFLLAFFAFGQALVFFRSRNLYALALSHAIWGMVLLVHTTR